MLTITRRAVLNAIKYRFASGSTHQAPKPTQSDQNIDRVDQYAIRPPTEPRVFSLTFLISKSPRFVTNNLIKAASKLMPSTKSAIASDYIVPPKIHENSVFVYQSIHLGSWLRNVRSLDIIFPLALPFTKPFFYLFMLGAHYCFWASNSIYELSRSLVIRMDVLPHIESVAFQKVGWFGRVRTIIVPVNRLKHTHSMDKQTMFWSANKSTLDKKMVFESTETGEIFTFDREGLWSEQGLNHPLIN